MKSQREHDQQYLGRFLGLAMAAEDMPSTVDARIRARLVELLREYQSFSPLVPDANAGVNGADAQSVMRPGD